MAKKVDEAQGRAVDHQPLDDGSAAKAAADEADVPSMRAFRIKGNKPTNCDAPTFMQRGIKGRDGDGPCTVLKRPCMMPNGDIAPADATFDPVAEHMTRRRYEALVRKKRISKAKGDIAGKLEDQKQKASASSGGR